ncbi:MAG: hypothetical protein JO100_07685 [Pseudonocardia sp.]|nr:hypothetical protein [Pseudonocardia sp.]
MSALPELQLTQPLSPVSSATDETRRIAAAEQDPAPASARDPRIRLRRMVSGMFWDVGLAVVAYYGARAFGASEYTAMLAGTLVSGARVLWVAVSARRLDPFAGFLLLIFGAGFALTFVTGDARFMLVKDSFITALAGLVFLVSCLVRRPLNYYAALRLAGPDGAAKLRARAESMPEVRHRFLVMGLVWGVGLLVEASARVPLIYLLSLDVAVGVSTVLQIAAYSLLIGWTVRYVKRAGAGPDRRRPAVR